MRTPEWVPPGDQYCHIDNDSWGVVRLFELSKNLPVMEIPLEHLNMYYHYEDLSLREMVMHFKAVEAADLSKPIILDEDGALMDGRHRIMKALMVGAKTIKAVRFPVNPEPCNSND